ncbi:MAG: alanine--tRNA ligase-related protein [Nitrososphaerota archaeon]|nr:alanine--tRNA ligase-related protein [Nitrososphaerota archaeon]
MTELLYMYDSYLKEFDAKVIEVLGDNVVLDRTAFRPRGVGLPEDIGILARSREEFEVIQVFRKDSKVLHNVPRHRLSVGERVRGIHDYENAYRDSCFNSRI